MIGIDLQSLARALGGEVSNNQVLCPGPGHSAKDRSLSVKLDAGAPDGFIVNSFASDDAIECKDFVRAKLSLPAFKPNGGGGRRRRASTADISNMLAAAIQSVESEPAKGRIIDTYQYTDAAGSLLYEVVRFEPKDFRQRRPDGKGGWIWKIDGTPRVPYQLPELLKFPHGTTFVCEGEKDSDNVASLNLCATTVACGDWTGDCVKALAGRDVLILQDVDRNEAGRKKALAAAAKLYGTASTIRIVRLPGLTGEPGSTDVSDWLDADPSRGAKLADICFEAPLWTPETAEVAAATGDKATSSRIPWTVPVLPWRDPETIPRRMFLYGHHYARGFVSATIADGGIGKSLLKIAEFLTCASGLPLLGITPTERIRVLYWNGDDPYVEVERRIHAACQHHGIDLKKLIEERWLFVGTRDRQPLCIAETKGHSVTVNQDAVADICAFIKENDIGLACFDPLKSVHRVPENSNDDMDIIGDAFNVIAEHTNAAIGLDHHIRKMAFGQTDVTTADARGATALINKVRLSRVLNLMTPTLATQARIKEDDRRRYFRADGGKANIAPPAKATWFKIVSVDCANGEHTPTVAAWTYPNAFDAVTPEHVHRVRTMAAEGSYRKDSRAEDWIGRAVAEVLDLDLDDEADRRQVKDILKTWFANGVLMTQERQDQWRKGKGYVVPGNWTDKDCGS